MRVKTADLRNNLSRYIREVRENSETIVVCDRDRPVAVLSPVADENDLEWEQHKMDIKAAKEEEAVMAAKLASA